MAAVRDYFTPRFAPELEPLVRPIGEVKLYPRNVRKHPKEQLKKIQDSLADFGQQTPLTVQRSTGYVLKGNGTLMAMHEMKWDRAAFHVVDVDDATAAAYALADNRAAEGGEEDVKKTVALLDEFGGQQEGWLATAGYSDEQYVDLQELAFGASVVDPGAFTGDYAPDDPDRKDKQTKPGVKAKNTPLIMSVEEHALFIGKVRAVGKALGLTTTAGILVEAVTRLNDQLAGRDKALPVANAAEAKLELLQELVLHYDDMGTNTLRASDVAKHLQGLIDHQRSLLPKVEPKVLPGQTGAFEVTDTSSMVPWAPDDDGDHSAFTHDDDYDDDPGPPAVGGEPEAAVPAEGQPEAVQQEQVGAGATPADEGDPEADEANAERQADEDEDDLLAQAWASR